MSESPWFHGHRFSSRQPGGSGRAQGGTWQSIRRFAVILVAGEVEFESPEEVEVTGHMLPASRVQEE